MKPKSVSQAMIDRAIRAAEGRGLTVSGIELQPDGAVRILTGDVPATPDDPLAAWEAKHGLGKFAPDTPIATPNASRISGAPSYPPLTGAVRKLLQRFTATMTDKVTEAALKGRRLLTEAEVAALSGLSVEELRKAALGIPWIPWEGTGELRFNRLAITFMSSALRNAEVFVLPGPKQQAD